MARPGLLGVKDKAGNPLLQGAARHGLRQPGGAPLTHVVPFRFEDRLTQGGGKSHRAFFPFAPHVEEDRRLNTGQNPASAGAVGRRVAAHLAARG